MNRTINELVTEALLTIREFPLEEAPEQKYILEGIRIYNLIKDSFSAAGNEIPFFTTLKFNLQPNKDIYKIGPDSSNDVIALPPVEMNSAFLIYQQRQWPLKVYFYSESDDLGLLTTLKSIGDFLLMQRQADYTQMQIYPVPNAPYEIVLRFKGALPDAQNQDEIKAIPPYYHNYLVLKIAKYYSFRLPTAQWTPDMEAELQKEEAKFTLSADIDLGLDVSNQLYNTTGYYDPSSIYRGC